MGPLEPLSELPSSPGVGPLEPLSELTPRLPAGSADVQGSDQLQPSGPVRNLRAHAGPVLPLARSEEQG